MYNTIMWAYFQLVIRTVYNHLIRSAWLSRSSNSLWQYKFVCHRSLWCNMDKQQTKCSVYNYCSGSWHVDPWQSISLWHCKTLLRLNPSWALQCEREAQVNIRQSRRFFFFLSIYSKVCKLLLCILSDILGLFGWTVFQLISFLEQNVFFHSLK